MSAMDEKTRKKFVDKVSRKLVRHSKESRRKLAKMALRIGFGSFSLRVIELNRLLSKIFREAGYDKDEVKNIIRAAMATTTSKAAAVSKRVSMSKRFVR